MGSPMHEHSLTLSSALKSPDPIKFYQIQSRDDLAHLGISGVPIINDVKKIPTKFKVSQHGNRLNLNVSIESK